MSSVNICYYHMCISGSKVFLEESLHLLLLEVYFRQKGVVSRVSTSVISVLVSGSKVF